MLISNHSATYFMQTVQNEQKLFIHFCRILFWLQWLSCICCLTQTWLRFYLNLKWFMWYFTNTPCFSAALVETRSLWKAWSQTGSVQHRNSSPAPVVRCCSTSLFCIKKVQISALLPSFLLQKCLFTAHLLLLGSDWITACH